MKFNSKQFSFFQRTGRCRKSCLDGVAQFYQYYFIRIYPLVSTTQRASYLVHKICYLASLNSSFLPDDTQISSKFVYQVSLSMIKLATVGRSCHDRTHLNYDPIQQFALFCPRNQVSVQTLWLLTKTTL